MTAAALGRSRSWLTSKVHLAADRHCRPLSFVLTPGQAADSPRFRAVAERIKVRVPAGRPRTRPGAVADDKAYSSRANRAYLRKRKIKAVIPEKVDQAASRKKKGSRGGRPVTQTPRCTGNATQSNAASTRSSSGAGWPLATTRHPRATSPASNCAARSYGSAASNPPEDPNPEHALAAVRGVSHRHGAGSCAVRGVLHAGNT
ncbi:transposase [Streptomyces zhaozhouensis]|uniref:transposase n=1 Tax=Streptomyces zhaozhouensis TaxID=1300267 RepID=UPI003F6DFCD2